MKSDSERILVHSFRNNRVDFDDAQFQTSNVLISVRESRLNLRAVNEQHFQLRSKKMKGKVGDSH